MQAWQGGTAVTASGRLSQPQAGFPVGPGQAQPAAGIPHAGVTNGAGGLSTQLPVQSFSHMAPASPGSGNYRVASHSLASQSEASPNSGDQGKSLQEAAHSLAAATAAAAASAAMSVKEIDTARQMNVLIPPAQNSTVETASSKATEPPLPPIRTIPSPKKSPEQERVGQGLGEPLLGVAAAKDERGSERPKEASFIAGRLVPVILFVVGICCVYVGFEQVAAEHNAAGKAVARVGAAGMLVPVLVACLLGLACRQRCRRGRA